MPSAMAWATRSRVRLLSADLLECGGDAGLEAAVVVRVEQPEVVGRILGESQVGVGHGMQPLIGVQQRAVVGGGLELRAQLAQRLQRNSARIASLFSK